MHYSRAYRFVHGCWIAGAGLTYGNFCVKTYRLAPDKRDLYIAAAITPPFFYFFWPLVLTCMNEPLLGPPKP